MSNTSPVRRERDGPLAVLTATKLANGLFGTRDLQDAVRSFLAVGSGKATYEGR